MPLSTTAAAPPPSAAASTTLDWVCHYGSLYGPQLVLLLTLSAITIYRREISCNHCYHKREEEKNDEDDVEERNDRGGSTTAASQRRRTGNGEEEPHHYHYQWYDDYYYYHWNNQQAEVLLDGVGWTFSGTPLLRSLLPFFLEECHKHIICPTKATAAAAFLIDNDGCYNNENDNDNNNTKTIPDMDVWLDNAGHFLAGMPAWRRWLSTTRSYDGCATSWTTENTPPAKLMLGPLGLPSDVWVHVTSYLTAREVTHIALVHKATHDWVNHSSNHALWTMMWHRDFAYTQDATAPWNNRHCTAARGRDDNILVEGDATPPPPTTTGTTTTSGTGSNNTAMILRPADWLPQQTQHSMNAEFYYTYAACWLDYCLAGRNTAESCLVGIEGNVYDVTDFVTEHPGSPETLLVHAGRDATTAFTVVRHSQRALRQAGTWCVARSLAHGAVVPASSTSPAAPDADVGNTPRSNSSGSSSSRRSVHHRPSTHNTLHRIQQWYNRTQEEAKIRAHRRLANTRRLTDVHVYYDPFVKSWNAWYTNEEMENVWVYQI